MILATFSGLRGGFVLTMLYLVLSRSFRQVAAEVSQKFYPTVGSTLRPFSTSNVQCGEEPCSGKIRFLTVFPCVESVVSNKMHLH